MNIVDRIATVQAQISAAALAAGRDPQEITLCAASKVQTDETIQAAIASGITLCGENRVQELTGHLEADAYAGADVHFIGHLQTNKVKQVVGRVSLIHSVDSEKLMRAIHSQGEKLGIVQDILIEVNIAQEPSKGGVLPQDALALAQLSTQFPHIRLRGLMAIPPITAVPGENREYFSSMHQLYIDIRQKMVDNQSNINCLSMGMSGDFTDAIAEGATLVRVGTAIFGARPPLTTH